MCVKSITLSTFYSVKVTKYAFVLWCCTYFTTYSTLDPISMVKGQITVFAATSFQHCVSYLTSDLSAVLNN